MKFKRILSFILAILMFVPVFAACDADEPAVTPGVSDNSDTSPTGETIPPEENGLVLDKTNLEGAVLRIHGDDGSTSYGYYETGDIWKEEDSSDPFDASVYKRAQDCINKYNFSIVYTNSANPLADVTSMVSGGLDQVDLVFGAWSRIFPASKAGVLYDLREIETIDLSGEWWDQNANTELSLANRLFYTAGELTTVDDRCTRALYFNKALATANNLESPYELVRSNQWTFDKFAEMCRSVYNDVDGAGEYDEDDIVGFFYEAFQFSYFMTAMGEKIATLDENGKPVYSYLSTSEAVTKMEKIAELLIDNEATFHVNDYKNLGSFSNKWAYGRGKFAAGKHLFSVGGALVITEFVDMEDEFGIIPMPKWTSEQDRYYHIIETSAPLFGVPNTKTDTTDLGYMLEYFSYEGMNTVTPAYKEKMLKRRYAQDADSADMLDIIYASKCFDIGYVGNWNNISRLGDSSVENRKIPKMSSINRAGKNIPNLIEKEYETLVNIGKANTQ